MSLAYATSLIGSATTLWTACGLQAWGDGDLVQLNEAIDFLETAQGQDDINNTSGMLLAPHFSLRPALQKDANGDNLDLSISYYVQALDRLHPQKPQSRTDTL